MAAWAVLSPPWANDLVGGDEGYYGVMARNMAADRAQWPAPSLSPLGEPGDKPPLYPAMVALSLRAFGHTPLGVRAPSLLASVVILWACALLARRASSDAGGWATLAILATLPWFADAARVACAELPLAAFGLLALLVLSGGTPGLPRGLAAGVLFGFGFLCKLWLVVLPGIPALLYLLPRRRHVLLTGLMIGFMTVVIAHLGLFAWLNPGRLQLWANVAWTFSLSSRAVGQGFASYWLHGPTYYAEIVFKALALTMPLLMVGTLHAAVGNTKPFARALVGAFAGLALMSLFRVKSGIYMVPLVPLLAALAGVGFAELYAGFKSWPLPLPTGAARGFGFLVVGIAVLVGGARTVQRLPMRYHDTGYAAISGAIAPYLQIAPSGRGVPDGGSGRAVLVAPEAPSFAFHLFRPVEYWDTPYHPWSAERFAALASDSGPRAFVVDPTQRFYGGWPDSATVRWLEAHTREITSEVPTRYRRPLELRVFVKP
ncbi:MAG: glycosyltransferase family 39 protein [Candidatus Eisenbacteria bacterium]|uniref:Glycosyltransferase family 39 protein n=1 Tax=Eiseniibacteriota bacterium TaxID=2212470 RepID=A0A933W355_UNCEI|nr:glycosyltransferase family 39 protein [Candidatus Eisenbacteria bacterium]